MIGKTRAIVVIAVMFWAPRAGATYAPQARTAQPELLFRMTLQNDMRGL